MKKALLLLALFAVSSTVPAADEAADLETLRAAAERGEVEAQYELGVLYEFGFNFPEHRPAAFAWYSRAAEQGNPLAAERRDLLKTQLSAAEIERAQALIKVSPQPANTAAR